MRSIRKRLSLNTIDYLGQVTYLLFVYLFVGWLKMCWNFHNFEDLGNAQWIPLLFKHQLFRILALIVAAFSSRLPLKLSNVKNIDASVIVPDIHYQTLCQGFDVLKPTLFHLIPEQYLI